MVSAAAALPASAQRSTTAEVSVPVGVLARAEARPAEPGGGSVHAAGAFAWDITIRSNTAWRLVPAVAPGVELSVTELPAGVTATSEAWASEAAGALARGPAGSAIRMRVEGRWPAGYTAGGIRFELLPD